MSNTGRILDPMGLLILPPDPYRDADYGPLFVVFRPLADWAGYGIDTDGFFWSCRLIGRDMGFVDRWRKVVPRIDKSGHLRVNIYRFAPGRYGKVSRYVHRLVLETFIGPCPAGMEACHNDGNPSNNRVGNLRWDTDQANSDDLTRHGRRAVGERGGGAKLTTLLVRDIREMRTRGMSQQAIADGIGIGQSQVSRILRGKNWRHLRQ